MLHLYNGLVLLLIYLGAALRHRRKIHVPIMITAFTLDMLSVLYLEFTKNVIMEAMEHASTSSVQVHLTCAGMTLLGYGVAILTGRKILQGKSLYAVHRTNAVIFLIARTGVFITSFWVLPV